MLSSEDICSALVYVPQAAMCLPWFWWGITKCGLACLVQALYQIDESTETGTCATAIKDNDRSLVANLAAANNYKVKFCP